MLIKGAPGYQSVCGQVWSRRSWDICTLKRLKKMFLIFENRMLCPFEEMEFIGQAWKQPHNHWPQLIAMVDWSLRNLQHIWLTHFNLYMIGRKMRAYHLLFSPCRVCFFPYSSIQCLCRALCELRGGTVKRSMMLGRVVVRTLCNGKYTINIYGKHDEECL